MDRSVGSGSGRRALRVAVRVAVPALFALSMWYLFTHVIRFGYVVSRSMEPTLQVGDYYIVDLRAYGPHRRPERGDIIVFTDANGDPWVKRIIGLSGERLLVVGGNVWLRGGWLQEPYLKERPGFAPPFVVQVPDDALYVMGDNRNLSEDSRDDGPVPVNRIMGLVTRVVWPLSHARRFEPVQYAAVGGAPGEAPGPPQG